MFSPLPLLSLITTYPFEVATRPDSSVIWVSATVHTGWPRPGTGVPSPGTTGVGEGAYANAGAAPRKNASTPMNDTTTARRIGQVSQSRSSCGGPSPLPGRRDGRHRVRRQLGRQRLVHSRVHHGALRGVLARAHLAPGVHPRHQVTTLVRHPRPELHRRPGKPSLHLGPELGEPGAGAGRDEHRVGPQPLEAQQRLLLCRVDLVHDEQLGHRVRAHLGEHLTYRPDLLLRVGMRTVDHVQDQVGVGDLFQGRPERLDQLVRRVPRLVSRTVRMPAMSRLRREIRVLMRLRSVSSFVSPGPRRPIPPPWEPTRPPACRLIASPQPRSRGSRYCSWASSTCALPSLLLACWAKMSRISAVRSMTLTLTSASSVRSWLGESSPSQMTVSAAVASTTSRSSPTLPRPMYVDGSGRLRRWISPSSTCEPAVSARAASSANELSASTAVPSVQTPTRTTRSSRSWRYSTSEMSASSVDRPATRRRARRSSSSRSPAEGSSRSSKSGAKSGLTRKTISSNRRRLVARQS